MTPLLASIPHMVSRRREPSGKGASSRGPHRSVGTPHFFAIMVAAPSVPKLQCGMKRASICFWRKWSTTRADVFLIADDAVGQDGFEVDESDVPAIETPLDLSLEAECVFVGEDELSDGTKADKRLLARQGATPILISTGLLLRWSFGVNATSYSFLFTTFREHGAAFPS